MRGGETMAGPTAPAAEGGAGRDAADTAVAAVAALLAASPISQALFDAEGRCVAASPSFTRRAAGAADARGVLAESFLAEAQISSVELGGRSLRLITLADSRADTRAGAPAAEPVRAEGAAAGDALLHALLHAVPAIINAKDLQSRYLFMNEHQARLYGTTPQTAVGRTAGEMLGAAYGEYTSSLDRNVIETGTAVPFYEEAYATADGVVRQWLTTKVPLRDSTGGDIYGVATIGFDISDRKRLEKTLLETKMTAEAASQSKTLFLAQISHELRTPLNAIIGFTEMMAQEIFGALGAPQYKGYAHDVLKAARHLLGIITDMLDVTRLDAGALALDLAAVPPGEIAAEAGRMVALTASTKRVVLRHHVEPDLPDLKADPRRLRQALINLISNAVKFTPEGGTITFGARRAAEGGVELYVEDSGIGMSPDEVEVALLVFGRVRQGYARAQEGTGIGLPLAKALIERQGGRFDIESAPGRGTKVRAIFPPAFLVQEPGLGAP